MFVAGVKGLVGMEGKERMLCPENGEGVSAERMGTRGEGGLVVYRLEICA